MTTETKSQLSSLQILEAARRFFLGDEPVCQAWLESESDTSLTFNTFKTNIVVNWGASPNTAGDLAGYRVYRDAAVSTNVGSTG